ncbi:uncharacterized protein BCR38DRAFT_528172 [Pseudomassariella vexata]|uniref:Uncharacterized protein n=1 Tax=Pseudomassariella vexata TaxID=1141098 RepID=A0A1Y2DDS6_9PEZI|nr:uncharacterized protein BCR38DRAFT_528172 [Pseudomassariella vexata]ORY57254.1 hypothetical protein BCR38DRAFT_528172 [Pseudomassariella vexata]
MSQLDSAAEETVDELLPALKTSPFGQSKKFDREETVGGRKLLHGPGRHYRRLIVPSLAAQGDRSVFFPGFIHAIYTPMVSENAWSRKQYVAQGTKHAYAIYDFLPYIDTLFKDIGVNPNRKKFSLTSLFTPVYPREYKGIANEFCKAVAKRHGLNSTAASIPGAAAPGSNGKGEDSGVFNGFSTATVAINGYATGISLDGGHKSSLKPFNSTEIP